MRDFIQIVKEKLNPVNSFFKGLFMKPAVEKEHSETYKKSVKIFNRYSLVFHAVIALAVVFVIEWCSRRSLISACSFVAAHTMAYFYNAFIVFATLSLVYLSRRRSFWRVFISCVWLILGIINGCVLSNRVTPFGFTDINCVPDLLTMTGAKYFTATQATLVAIGGVIFALALVLFFLRGPKYKGKRRYVIAPLCVAILLFGAVPFVTSAAQRTNVVATYFSNIAQGYQDYGFVYSFSSSVVGRGMSKPDNYSEDTITAIEQDVDHASTETTFVNGKKVNVIVILLESFVDPAQINYLDVNEDPIPFMHYLEENYSTGYCTVPVVGAGTSNSEFEVLTGMSMQYFGTGEYPHKTILKEIEGCESVASDMKALGYGTHVVHNNGGNFYSRVNAFSQMGFDTFTSKEMMDITEFNPLGSWAEDAILVDETIKAMKATPDQPDMIYTITVGTHGDYPKEPVIEDPYYLTSGSASEEQTNQWNYYVHQLHKTDEFLRNLCTQLEELGEDTIVIGFGDHLPTMGLTDEDMVSGDIYKTQYVTWNNFGLQKEDADLYAYQLVAHYLDRLGIHEGTMMKYHQTMANSATYDQGMELLQYDLLYGDRFTYGGKDAVNPYPASDIIMGIDDVIVDSVELVTGEAEDDASYYVIKGSGFTNWSRVFVNDEKVSTEYVSGNELHISEGSMTAGDTFKVCQMGSSNTLFRASNEMICGDGVDTSK